MPTNRRGPGDNWSPSYVLPALIRKFHEAKVSGEQEVVVWGSGQPRREFLYSEDRRDAALFLMENYDDPSPINVGVGEDVAISGAGAARREVVGFDGDIVYDRSSRTGRQEATRRLEAPFGRLVGRPPRPGPSPRTYDWFLQTQAVPAPA